MGSRPLDNLPFEYVGFVLNLQVCHLLIQVIPDSLKVSNCPKGPLGVGDGDDKTQGEGLGGEKSNEIAITGPEPSCCISFSLHNPPTLAFTLISSYPSLPPSFTFSMLTHHGYYDVSKDNGTK